MSTADALSGAGPTGQPPSTVSRTGDARGRSALNVRTSTSAASPTGAPGSGERVTSKDVLRQVASEAMQSPPPRDMVVLRASASKYLLTSLEPALELGEQIRRELSEAHAARADAAMISSDRSRAADLLDPARSPDR